jgi:hypothetical protein
LKLRRYNKGSQAAVAEFGYNFYAALQQYNYDSDVELFLKVRRHSLTPA